MATIRPFRAWRYNAEKISDIYGVFSPLFDVVNAEQLAKLYQNPHNSIHLSVPKSHEAVVEKLAEWKQNNIILQDEKPALYAYYQTFELPIEAETFTRKGFICMIKMKSEAENDILLHEDTLAHSVKDRIALLEKTRLNVAPTHGLYTDAQFQLEALMDEYMQTPLYEYQDYQGVINKIAIISQEKDVEKFLQILDKQNVYLADGHHRFESSKVLRDKVRAENGDNFWDENALINYHLMYLTNICADDLRILPTHRIWRPLENITLADVLSRMFPYWKVMDVTDYPQPIYSLLQKKKYAFGLLHKNKEYLVEIRLGLQTNIELEIPDALKQLSYTVLHYYLFEKVAKIPYAEQSKNREIIYEKSYSAAMQAAQEGAFVFICQEVKMEEMINICETGYKMPQKSTYFYPKVVCGLVFGEVN